MNIQKKHKYQHQGVPCSTLHEADEGCIHPSVPYFAYTVLYTNVGKLLWYFRIFNSFLTNT